MRRRELSAMGAEARRKQGAETAEFIFEVLKKNPYGLSVYEISHELGQRQKKDEKEERKRTVEPGTVHSALTRLLRDGKIEMKESTREGRTIKLAYPKGFAKEEQVLGYFKISKDQLQQWHFKKELFGYSVNRDTLKISETKISDLENRRFKEMIIPTYAEDYMLFSLPTEIIDFYELNNNLAKANVEGRYIIIKVNPTSAQSEENTAIQSLKNETALIADDDPGFLSETMRNVKDHFRQAYSAATKKEAEKIIETKRPSILIIDWKFAEKPVGEELLKFAKKKYKPKAIIMITGEPNDRGDIKHLIELGAIWCYDKDVSDLSGKILLKATRSMLA